MNKMFEILDLLHQRDYYLSKLKSMNFGSVEIREKNDYKYMYTHYILDGDSYTRYIGEYTDDSYNQAIDNNNEAKKIKKELKKINNRLDDLGFNDEELSEDVKWNIDLARRQLTDTIYKQAILEGVNTTFVKTEKIIESGVINNVPVDSVLVIVGLKHAWDFILNKYVITTKSDYYILCGINKYVEESFSYNAGRIRTVPVSISGTTWTPDFPIESDIKEDIEKIVNKKANDIDKAIELLLYVSRKQMFIDGNKRTAVIFANHYLISKGKGLLVVPDNRTEEYKKLLIEYYESNNSKNISKFLKECFTKLK